MEEVESNFTKLGVEPASDSAGDSVCSLSVQIDVLYNDEHLAIVWKPANVATHRKPGVQNGSVNQYFLSDLLRYVLPQAKEGAEMLIVTRLEKAIPGLVVVAKSKEVYQALRHLASDKKIVTTYFGVCHGRVGKGKPGSQLCLELPIDNWAAITSCRVVDVFRTNSNPEGYLSLVELRGLVNHLCAAQQFRIHLYANGNPLVGNIHWTHPLSGRVETPASSALESRQRICLALVGLELRHPVKGEKVKVNIAIPDDFSSILNSEQAAFTAHHPPSGPPTEALRSPSPHLENAMSRLADNISSSLEDNECFFFGLQYLSHPLYALPTALTELITNAAIDLLRRKILELETGRRVLVLDLGAEAGMSCAQVLLGLDDDERKRVLIFGVCSSKDVYEIAVQNVALSELQENVVLYPGNWTMAGSQSPLLHAIQEWVYENASEQGCGVDLVMSSNIPWISQSEWTALHRPPFNKVDKRSYVSGVGGLESYSRLLDVSKSLLRLNVDLHNQHQSEKDSKTGKGLFLKPENGALSLASPSPMEMAASGEFSKAYPNHAPDASGSSNLLKRQSSLMQRKYSLSKVLKSYGSGYNSEGWGSLGRKDRPLDANSPVRGELEGGAPFGAESAVVGASGGSQKRENVVFDGLPEPPTTVFQQYSDVVARRKPVWNPEQTVLLIGVPSVRKSAIVDDIFASWKVDEERSDDCFTVLLASFARQMF